jgi:hypothetical protein
MSVAVMVTILDPGSAPDGFGLVTEHPSSLFAYDDSPRPIEKQ